MTVNTASVQTARAVWHAALISLFIVPIIDGSKTIFSLMKKYCFDHDVLEILVRGVVATMIVAFIDVGQTFWWWSPLCGVWSNLLLVGYCFLPLGSQHERWLDSETQVLQNTSKASDTDITELVDALT